MKKDFLEYIKQRGFYNQCTNDEGLIKELDNNLVAYTGFDCTAESLHIGSLVQIMMLRTFQKFGLKPIVLLGGGTTMIGDPSGKDETRKILNLEKINKNKNNLKNLFEKFLDFKSVNNKAIFVDNYEWLSKLDFITFVRDIGSQFSVNKMLSFESVKLRLERQQNLSFLEFNYMILQSYDFLELYKKYNCKLQFGGSDQWGNIISGIDLVKRKKSTELFGLTSPLIKTSTGEKMGKTNSGAIWLTEEKLSSYEYWQYWRNTSDKDVINFLKLFTEVDLIEIKKFERLKGSELNDAKILLANETTKICHGPEKASIAEKSARLLFDNKSITNNIPEKHIIKINLNIQKEYSLKEALVDINLTSSLGDSKRLIDNGGVKLNDLKITNKNYVLTSKDFKNNLLKVSVGKKKHGLVKI